MIEYVSAFIAISLVVFPIYFLGFFIGRWYYKPKKQRAE